MPIRFSNLCFCLFAFSATAQDYRTDVRHRAAFWSEVNLVYRTAGKWSVQFDHQYRRQAEDNNVHDRNPFRFPLLQVFRPWVNYQISKPVRLSLSPIGLWWNWGRTDAYQPTTFFQEVRVIPQLQISKPAGDGEFIQRYRAELRWPSRTDTLTRAYAFLSDGEPQPVLTNRFNVRLRTMARWINPIWGGPLSGWYSHLSVEPMVVVSAADFGARFDQNRTYVALGRRLRENLRVELGYLNQFSMAKNEAQRLRTVRLNHALHVYVYLENRRRSQAKPNPGPE